MIWLIKSREKTISDNEKEIPTYLKKGMEPAENYVKNIKHKKLTKEIQTNAEYHLCQLMEIYVDCKIIEKYLCLKTDSEKIDFFCHFLDENYLKEVCDFSENYCSQLEYKSFSDLMKNRIDELFDEYIRDFHRAFLNVVEDKKKRPSISEASFTNEITSCISFYVNQGLWATLRILPTSLCPCPTIFFNNAKYPVYDFISNNILTFDKKFNLEPIFNNFKFYKDAARDSFLYLLDLAKYLYDSNENIRLDRLEKDVEKLNQNDFEKTNLINKLSIMVNELDKKINNKNTKLINYKTLPKNELINAFYDFYKVQKNFLDILQTYPFEEKIILSKDFHITEGYQALLVQYLDSYVDKRRNIALLKVLFNIKARNPAATKIKNSSKRLKDFKYFIEKYAK